MYHLLKLTYRLLKQVTKLHEKNALALYDTKMMNTSLHVIDFMQVRYGTRGCL